MPAHLEVLPGRGAAVRLTLATADGAEHVLDLDSAGLRELTVLLARGDERAAVYRLVRQGRLVAHPHDRFVAALADVSRLYSIE